MPYSPTTWTEGVTTLGPTNMNHIEQGIASLSAPAPSATPPATPADGDIWYLPADATNGIIWQFRYNASGSTYKWEFVGGNPLMAFTGASGNPGSASSWVDIGSGGQPQLAAPRAGDYRVDVRARFATPATASTTGFITVVVTGRSPGNFQVGQQNMAGSGVIDLAGFTSAVQQSADFGAIPASTLLRIMYYATDTGVTFSNRTLYLTPIRVS